MEIESLQEELAGENRTLSMLVDECNRLLTAEREMRALAAEQDTDWARTQYTASEVDFANQLRVMQRRRHEQEVIVQNVTDRIEDQRRQRDANLAMFGRVQRQSAEVVPFPAASNSPEAA